MKGDVRYWHTADIGLRRVNVRFGGKAGTLRTRRSCLLLTQSGHHPREGRSDSQVNWCDAPIATSTCVV
ncbi:MAG: hypothetical protein WBE89_07655, partial [Methyloceanibacter sp.]